MTAYYNEHEPYCAAWLRNLIAAGQIASGDVDARDIQDVTPDDLTGYTQCHFFAGLGGWSYALRLAGWPDDRPVWTGSCPCQPFSAAGKRAGTDDPRHLWPEWVRLIRKCRPVTAIGEQVASAIAHGWLDGVSADLEAEGYTVGAVVLGAHSVGAPHIRQRLWWVAERVGVSDRPGRRAGIVATAAARHGDPAESTSRADGLADAKRAEWGPVDHARRDERLDGVSPRQEGAGRTRSGGEDGGLGDARHSAQSPLGAVSEGTDATEPERGTGGLGNTSVSGNRAYDGQSEPSTGPQKPTRRSGVPLRLGDAAPRGRLEERADARRGRERSAPEGWEQRPWDDCRLISCADGTARRIEPGTFPLAHGTPNRVGRLRAYGNAIVPHVAAVFIRAYRESMTAWR